MERKIPASVAGPAVAGIDKYDKEITVRSVDGRLGEGNRSLEEGNANQAKT
jgi:hypothetical protein